MAESVTDLRFLILHGWQNHRPVEHWQHWLADRLTARGHVVEYPALPDPDHPRLDHWLAEVTARLAVIGGPTTTVICHSLACLLWLNIVPCRSPARVDRVLLVAPPSRDFIRQTPEIAEFLPSAVTAEQLSASARQTRIVSTDNDPCCPEGAESAHARSMGVPLDVLAGAGHITPDSGYGSWPSLLAWSLDPFHERPIRSRSDSGAP